MAEQQDWRAIVASSLDWEQAHAKLDSALADLPAELRGKRPEGLPHSIWEQVEHIRLTLHDLYDYSVNPKYEEPKWPGDYWPSSQAPKDDTEWNTSIATIQRENAEFAKFIADPSRDLTALIPHGHKHTYLRTYLVAVDHASYHIGQIVLLRRLLGAWPSQ